MLTSIVVIIGKKDFGTSTTWHKKEAPRPFRLILMILRKIL